MPINLGNLLRNGGLNRRDLFKRGGWLTAAFSGRAAGQDQPAGDIYRSIGVRPIINCQGDKTILSGSLVLPEVRRAMDEASRRFVNMDELMEAVGARLAKLTGAEWGIVTSGCAAAIAHATAACIAGADPEKIQRLPNLEGLKNEVVIPAYCRNMYDHAVRILGVRIVEVDSAEQMRAALNQRTAMIYTFYPREPFGLETIAAIAKQKGVPVFVDAAAEDFTIPNIHLRRGATLVGYSGGKALHGPQCAGLLLGRKDLVKAAFLNSAPHHSFGRPMKVGKEEVMGMLTAVEMWTKRDHGAERRSWASTMDAIATSVRHVPGVTTTVQVPEGPGGRPVLRIRWDAAQVGIGGEEVERLLAEGEPRIITPKGIGDRRANTASQITIVPAMMSPGDEKIVAERLYAVLAHPPAAAPDEGQSQINASVAGQWEFQIDFVCGTATHHFVLEQDGENIQGTHQGQFISGDLRGKVRGNRIRFLSSQPIESTWLHFNFDGEVSGGTMQGSVATDEYGQGRWTAVRRRYRIPGNEPFTKPLVRGA